MTKREAAWERLEEEYGVPIQQLLEDLLFNPYSPLTYQDAAAVLEISRTTLQSWREILGIPSRPTVRYTLSKKPSDVKAIEKGYQDIEDAIADLKLRGMTLSEMSGYLGVSERMVTEYTPESLKGVQNLSDTGRAALVESGRRNNANLSREKHPWRVGKF